MLNLFQKETLFLECGMAEKRTVLVMFSKLWKTEFRGNFVVKM